MLISEEVSRALTCRKASSMDKIVCDKYEAANELFEQLIKAGVITKRGHRLCPIENKVCVVAEINYSHKTDS